MGRGGRGGADAAGGTGIINSRGDIINSPIEQSHPVDVAFGAKELNQRQQKVLDMLPDCGSQVIVNKRDVSMLDLAALTSDTGNEFAMFTCKGKRMIVRGDESSVPLFESDIIRLREEGYRWSGHTHVGFTEAHLIASDGDIKVLSLTGQSNSVIYNSLGKYALIQPKEC